MVSSCYKKSNVIKINLFVTPFNRLTNNHTMHWECFILFNVNLSLKN